MNAKQPETFYTTKTTTQTHNNMKTPQGSKDPIANKPEKPDPSCPYVAITYRGGAVYQMRDFDTKEEATKFAKEVRDHSDLAAIVWEKAADFKYTLHAE